MPPMYYEYGKKYKRWLFVIPRVFLFKCSVCLNASASSSISTELERGPFRPLAIIYSNKNVLSVKLTISQRNVNLSNQVININAVKLIVRRLANTKMEYF